MNKYDAIVIGAGHNGLVNAAYLARAGLKTLVLERNPYIGGASVTRELYPGFKYSNCSYVCSLFRPEIFRELELSRHGLQVIPYEGGCLFTEDGGYIANYTDHEAQRREYARINPKDAEAYDDYGVDVMRQCRFIKPWLLRTPPDPTSKKPKDIRGLWQLYKELQELTEEQIYETLQFYTISCADYLNRFFESDQIKGNLAGSSIIGTGLGPYSPGSAYVLLHHYMGEVDGKIGSWGFARGGMGAIAQALANSFEEKDGEIKVGSSVEKLITNEGKATGVALENGDEYYADIIVSNLDVKRTFLKVVDQKDLPEDFVTQVKNFKIRGSSGKINIALDGLPTFPALPKGSPVLHGDMHIVDTMERLERGYDDWKNGTWSKDPYVDMLIPTQIDPTMTPHGKHMMTVFVQYAPPKLTTGDWTEKDKLSFGKTVIDAIAKHSPDFKDLILHAEIRTPQDIENEAGLTQGNIFHGELTLDQLLFNRPIPGYAQYRSPIPGFYMCGSSTHPGGGVMGAPGANAAREILSDKRMTK